MRDAELRGLLHRAGEELPEPDVAESTWSRGRVVRRRRWTVRVVGGLAALAVEGGLGVQVAGWADGGPRGTTGLAGGASDGPVQRLEPPATPLGAPAFPAPEPVELQDARERTQLSVDEAAEPRAAQEAAGTGGPPVRVTGSTDLLTGSALVLQSRQVCDVHVGCLESRGYAVSRDGPALSVPLPDGKQDGDYRRDTQACRAELVTDAPVSVPPGEDVDDEARAALTERYFQYYWVQSCLVDADLPTVPAMPAEEFITGLAWAQLPPWHPYAEAARQGRYAEARAACPVQVWP